MSGEAWDLGRREVIWYAVGLTGQALFSARFLVQWIQSERRKASVLPTAFWWLSLAGSATMFCYAIFFLKDPVIILGQSGGFIVYTRNLILRRREKLAHSASGA